MAFLKLVFLFLVRVLVGASADQGSLANCLVNSIVSLILLESKPESLSHSSESISVIH